MHPLLFKLTPRFDRRATREEIPDTISGLEDAFPELERETAAKPIEELSRRPDKAVS